jgi:trigger factor
MKRQLLDQLAARHDFQVPESMVEAEYQNIIAQLRHEASHEEDPQAALAEIEADADEYRNIAIRRVRLGLLLSEIGAENGVDVTEQEMSRLIMQAASQYQGKDRETFIRYIQQEPMAAAQLRAPLYEDKVVDFLFARADITDRKATREELEADLESEEGHVHGPGCGHDHAHDHGAKPKAKKAPAKAKDKAAKDEDQLVAEEPAKGPVETASAKPKPAKPVKDAAGAKAARAEDKPAPKPVPSKAEGKAPAKKPAKKG